MRKLELTYPHQLKLAELPPTVAAIGFFDGIHRGHQKLIQSAVAEAKSKQMESAVVTFHPHPSVVLKNNHKGVKYITSLSQKEAILEQLQVDRLYMITFNKELSLLSPEQFINHFINGLHIKHLIAGFDFTFGHQGKGNMDNIDTYAKDDFTYSVIPKVESDHEKISSTRIRNLLKVGQIEHVNTLLGRTFSVSGVVVEGDKRGRQIGFPTANVKVPSDVLLPKSGVYAVKVEHKHHTYQGMANIGVRPTFKTNLEEPSVEVNLFDVDRNLYGELLEVKLLKFIRAEKKFNHVEDLISQIKHDEQEIKTFFKQK